MTRLTINGRPVEVPEGTTLLKAATTAGFTVPNLCAHPDLRPYGGCRLCVVEVKGWPPPLPSCMLPVAEGMVVETETPGLIRSRQMILELLLSNYYDSRLLQPEADNEGIFPQNELAYWAAFYGVDMPGAMASRPRYALDSDPHPFIRVDLNKCILCTRCIRACADIQGRFVWSLAERGYDTHLVAGANTTMIEGHCESCGACVAYCPTGALDDRLSYGLGEADTLVTTTCPYCGVGCQLDLNVKDGKVMRVTSQPEAAVNGMHLCAKGRYGYDFIHHPDRLTRPRVRRYLLEGGQKSLQGQGGEWVETDWETALHLTAKKLRERREASGPDSIGLITSAKCLNEENYLMNKLARQALGTNNIDHCARLQQAGLAASVGCGAMSNSLEDVANLARAYLVIGSNTTEEHPVFGARLRQAVLQRGAKIIIADPRRIELCDYAALHLCPKPGTDIALVNGLMSIILEKGWEDKAFIEQRCQGFEELSATLRQYPPQKVAAITGLPVEALYQAAEILAANRPSAVICATGLTRHNVMALANLQLLLGNMGRPGGGLNPLASQNNAQGAGDMGGLPDFYPAYQAVADEEMHKKFQAAWGATAARKAGLTATEMNAALADGTLKALYILGDEPLMSDPGPTLLSPSLEAADFVVFQGIFPGATAPYADVLLPGVTFAEKSGTFSNTERRVQAVRQAIQPVGDSRPDWWITAEIAKRIVAAGGSRPIGEGPYAAWNYADTSEILSEINALAPSYGGITPARLEESGGLQWPCPTPGHPGTPILHTEQFTHGKGKLIPVDYLPPATRPGAE